MITTDLQASAPTYCLHDPYPNPSCSTEVLTAYLLLHLKQGTAAPTCHLQLYSSSPAMLLPPSMSAQTPSSPSNSLQTTPNLSLSPVPTPISRAPNKRKLQDILQHADMAATKLYRSVRPHDYNCTHASLPRSHRYRRISDLYTSSAVVALPLQRALLEP